MPCVHTGCDVFFPDYGSNSHGDLHKVGNAYIFIGHTPIYVANNYDWHMPYEVDGMSRQYGEVFIAISTRAIPLSNYAKDRYNEHR